ncbi:MAG: LicD family protein [Prevotellaceae bacterium]|nr:LicD family protein [Prevotellaceae bacterium]
MSEYTEEELLRLHEELYGILEEIVRVCSKLGIPYFILGGSAIGAFFWQGIIPWDDDIDIGMTRGNYERFLRQAPAELGEDYFLQWQGTDPHTPFYFAKVRKRGTLFVESKFSRLPIHHGIYVDVFPFDRVPDNQCLQRAHRGLCNFLNCCFIGKELWMWRHCGKCEIPDPSSRPWLPCLMTRLVDALLTKRAVYRILSALQACFNRWQTTYYNMVLMPRDHIAVASIESPQQVRFGRLTVTAPSDLETYLRHHYKNLRRHIPKQEQQNHRPALLSFDTKA